MRISNVKDALFAAALLCTKRPRNVIVLFAVVCMSLTFFYTRIETPVHSEPAFMSIKKIKQDIWDREYGNLHAGDNIHVFDTTADQVIDIDGAKWAIEQERLSKSKRLIAYSLYGSIDSYHIGAIENARIVNETWSKFGWKMRLYHDASVSADTVEKLRELGAETRLMQYKFGGRDHSGSLWRFLPAITDHDMTRLIVRDCDSRLTARDAAAVEEWIESEKYFHVMRDHHAHVATVLAGMWGVVGRFLKSGHLKNLIMNTKETRYFSVDQIFLRYAIWPHVAKYALAHDSYYCVENSDDTSPEAKLARVEAGRRNDINFDWATSEVRPFPTQRLDVFDFVGNPFREETDMKGMQLPGPCPVACRKSMLWSNC